ncbi:MAG TPA: TonB-dependent receptor [Thermoanaerobaculia bacterium]|nr:TonB-dependent receptor [Thermoanaerobaculia bacterium]
MKRLFPLFLTILALLMTVRVEAQPTGSIAGRVRSATGTSVPRATVTLVETNQTTNTSADGAFRFENLPAGTYHVAVEAPRLGASVAEIEVAAGQTARLEVTVDQAVHREEIVVTATPGSRGSSEVVQPVNVLTAEDLSARMQPTLGETLAQEPGVSSTYFGPGSSRPVIRGLGGDRIRILEEGIGTGDASNVSPDHAVSVDPSSAERIEIVRGPATLLYGSNAIGGVVNVLDNRVPSSVPTEITGRAELRLGSVADERGGSLSVEGGQSKLAWHLDLLQRDTGDFEIPGPADIHSDEDSGRLENSATRSTGGTIGASYVGSRGFIGASFNGLDSRYGIPGHHHHEEGEEEEEEEEEQVQIDMRQRRFDVRGELRPVSGFFRNLRLRAGRADYEHVELEGDEVGTLFTNESWEGRIEATHRPLGPLTGAMGVQLMTREFAAIGAEAFVPPSDTNARAVFLFEEATRGQWTVQFGTRFEQQKVSVEGDEPDRSFGGISGSLGAIYRPMPQYAVAVSLARGVRAPTAEELYSNGPHLATSSFEIGDSALDEETSIGVDVSLRKTEGKFHGELNLFSNRFDGFVFGNPSDEEEDGLRVVRYAQADAHFRGFEAGAHFELWHSEPHHIELGLGTDYVRATLDGGGNLPRIPPQRHSASLTYQGARFSGMAEVRRVTAQNRVAALEEPSPGYTMVNANVSYRFFLADTLHEVLLRGTNLTDELARSHVSPLREVAPLPGRDVSLSYRLSF